MVIDSAKLTLHERQEIESPITHSRSVNGAKKMTNEHWTKSITLVIGGTGKTGRRVADRLVKAGRPVRIGSRSTDLPFDWEQQDTWEQTLKGVKAAYVAYQPDLAVPGALAIVETFFDRAIACGVEKLVLLSGRGEVEAEQAEQALQKTSVDWTILRSSWFCQNFSESFFLDPILAGQVALPVVESVAEPYCRYRCCRTHRSATLAPALRDYWFKSYNLP
jgi:uncharacterized protein YbjT (DUF2867 family)